MSRPTLSDFEDFLKIFMLIFKNSDYLQKSITYQFLNDPVHGNLSITFNYEI